MLKSFTGTVLLYLIFSLITPVFAAEEPSMHEVYLAAEAGKFAEAQAMMDRVLSAHPNSAKAHFVEAELLAKQGLLSNAAIELGVAERLQPGLSFANPEAVKSLKSRIASVANVGALPKNSNPQTVPSDLKKWLPWFLLIACIGLVIWLIGYLNRRNSNIFPSNNYSGNASSPNMPPVGSAGTGAIAGQPATGGMGSGLMGSLATGAALGAGVVAGEALMHHFIDGDKNNNVTPEPPRHDTSPWIAPDNSSSDHYDMGGTDFGIADASSWDDDSGMSDGGGDDWT